MLEGRRRRDNELSAFLVDPDFDDPRLAIRRKVPQPRHQPLILRGLWVPQQVNGHVAPEAAPPAPEAFWTFPGHRFDQLVLLRHFHGGSAFIRHLTSYRALFRGASQNRRYIPPPMVP
jgi:hypothetical protein